MSTTLWGQTETAGTPLANAAWLTPAKPGSAGIQFLGAELAVVDDDGNPVGPNVLGNLIIKKPFPMLSRTLWNEPERFYEAYYSQVEGAYFSSDLALYDEDGHFWVVGRSDDAFNVAGHRLSTMEMESAVLEVKGVAEAAVIGIPDKIKGEVPLVFVRRNDSTIPENEIAAKVSDNIVQEIGKIAQPKEVVIVDALPKTISGKIMRRLLKEVATTGKVEGDVTGLDDPKVVEHIIDRLKTNGIH